MPEEDKRHFLYREYLKLIQHYRPAVFVMENVKGILTSRVGGERIFHRILEDLVDPDEASGGAAAARVIASTLSLIPRSSSGGVTRPLAFEATSFWSAPKITVFHRPGTGSS